MHARRRRIDRPCIERRNYEHRAHIQAWRDAIRRIDTDPERLARLVIVKIDSLEKS